MNSMSSSSDRLTLPLLAPGQAQKEMIHNEALARLDMLVQPVVKAVAPTAIPADPQPGDGWIVGDGATGAWAGQAGALAVWTAGGWRFAAPFEGMMVWSLADGMTVVRRAEGWQRGVIDAVTVRINGLSVLGVQQGAIAAPAGGTTTDTESRTAITAILEALRVHGLIAR